jgi:hypothetical protein
VNGAAEAGKASPMMTTWFWLGAGFTASGSFLTALGVGLREQAIEQPGVALIGAAVLAVLVAVKRAVEDRRPRPAPVTVVLHEPRRLKAR